MAMSEPAWLLHADTELVVLDKPAGMLAVPGRVQAHCLSALAQQHFPDALVVHRLDMATSGLMLMARGPVAQRALSQAFAARQVHKRYEAVVEGLLAPAEPQQPTGWGVIDLPIRADWERRPLRVIDAAAGKPSETRWRLLHHDATAQRTRLALEPVTGRSHQLRVHLQAIGHPIVGDALYGNAPAKGDRLLLHACILELAHPVSREALRFESPAPF